MHCIRLWPVFQIGPEFQLFACNKVLKSLKNMARLVIILTHNYLCTENCHNFFLLHHFSPIYLLPIDIYKSVKILSDCCPTPQDVANMTDLDLSNFIVANIDHFKVTWIITRMWLFAFNQYLFRHSAVLTGMELPAFLLPWQEEKQYSPVWQCTISIFLTHHVSIEIIIPLYDNVQ